MGKDKAMSGDDVRRLRKKLSLTQAALAERLGIHQVTVRKWESKSKKTRQNIGAAYARLLRMMATMQ